MTDAPFEKKGDSESIVLRGLRLRQVLEHHDIDTIIADSSHQAMASLLACAHAKTRVFIYAQSAPIESYDAIFAEHIHVMAVSDASARRFGDAPNVSVVLNGINRRRFTPAPSPVHEIRDKLGISASAFVIGNTGYLTGLKN